MVSGTICAKSNIYKGVVDIKDEHGNWVFTVNGTDEVCQEVDKETAIYYAYWRDVDGYITPHYQGRTLQEGGVLNFYGYYTPKNGGTPTTPDYGILLIILVILIIAILYYI